MSLRPQEVISKDAPFATSHFLRGLESLLSGFAARYFYFLLSFGVNNDPGLRVAPKLIWPNSEIRNSETETELFRNSDWLELIKFI